MVMMLEVVDIGHIMRLKIYLRIGPTMEILNRGLDEVVIESYNW